VEARGDLVGELATQLGEVASGPDLLAPLVEYAEPHGQVGGELTRIELPGADLHAGPCRELAREGLQQRARAVVEDVRELVGERRDVEVATRRLRQRAHQGLDLLGEQPRDEAVGAVGVDLPELLDGDVEGDTVVVGAGLVPVADIDGSARGREAVGVSRFAHLGRVADEHVVDRHVQDAAVLPLGGFAPLLEPLPAADVGRQPAVVEGEPGLRLRHQVAAARLVLEARDLRLELAVVEQRRRVCVVLALDQRVVDEELACLGGINGPEVGSPLGHELEPREQHLLERHDPSGLRVPVGSE
jgi:hypothetical protein